MRVVVVWGMWGKDANMILRQQAIIRFDWAAIIVWGFAVCFLFDEYILNILQNAISLPICTTTTTTKITPSQPENSFCPIIIIGMCFEGSEWMFDWSFGNLLPGRESEGA